jgi:putative tricarboxylic transport membrane protein
VSRKVRFELAFALGAIALGLYLFIGSSGINLGAGYDKIGPRFFPYIIAGGLLISASFMIFEALRRNGLNSDLHFEVAPLVLIVIGLLISILLLERLGFILAVTILFTLIARAFKSQQIIRDLFVGLILTTIVYYIFTSGLGLVLPRGILSGLV